MGIRWFLVLAVIAFLIATVGSDVFASVTIAGQPLANAVREHFYWAAVEAGDTLSLFVPFGVLAAIASWVEGKTRTRTSVLLFAGPTLYLMYSYFDGYRASQIEALHKHWTAATLAVAFLPVWAAPVVLIDWVAALILVRLRKGEQTAG